MPYLPKVFSNIDGNVFVWMTVQNKQIRNVINVIKINKGVRRSLNSVLLLENIEY